MPNRNVIKNYKIRVKNGRWIRHFVLRKGIRPYWPQVLDRSVRKIIFYQSEQFLVYRFSHPSRVSACLPACLVSLSNACTNPTVLNCTVYLLRLRGFDLPASTPTLPIFRRFVKNNSTTVAVPRGLFVTALQ
jgi:hypothetical protein